MAVVPLLAVLLLAAVASPAGHTKKTEVLQQLLTKREKLPEAEAQVKDARVQRRVQLSDDEREIMTKQIMQAISGTLHTHLFTVGDFMLSFSLKEKRY